MSYRHFIIGSLIICMLALANDVFASAASEVYRTKALVELSDGDPKVALQHLNAAIKIDAKDANLRYYLGITHIHLGHYAKAIEALKVAQSMNAENEGLLFNLAYAYFRNDQFEPALEYFNKAKDAETKRAQSNYYIGLINFRRNRFNETIEPLSLAAKQDPELVAASAFLLGQSYFKLGKYNQAINVLDKSIEEHPESVYVNNSSALLEKIKIKKNNAKPFSLLLSAGMAYDDNVGLFSDEIAMQDNIESKSDFYQQYIIGVNSKKMKFFRNNIRLGYQFYQSKYNQLDDYNIQSHGLTFSWNRQQGKLEISTQYNLNSVTLSGKKYSLMQKVVPSITYSHSNFNLSMVSTSLQKAKYQLEEQTGRDAYQLEAAIKHFLRFRKIKNLSMIGGLNWFLDKAKDKQYAYDAFGLHGGIQIYLPKVKVNFRAQTKYERRNYANYKVPYKSEQLESALALTRPLFKKLEIEGNVMHLNNSSSNIYYHYSKIMISLQLRWRL